MSKVQAGYQYLSGLRPWNGRGGFSLKELLAVLKRLGNPHNRLPTIHIAGTNGKGSVSAAVASILGQSGYRVGMNISPHLERMNERIVVDGYPCSDEFLGEFAYAIRQAAHSELVELSFHEAITAIAFLGLVEVGVDWAVIEVGLGGRLDASNVISRPAATAIVTIDYDHQHILGNTLGEIAAEKAGIIKPGSPLVTGILPSEADSVISKKALGNAHYKFGKHFDVRGMSGEGGERFEYWGKNVLTGRDVRFDFSPRLAGIHQGHNLGVAATLGLVVGCSSDSCKQGLEAVFWPGRLESIASGGREFILDSAHNPGGIRAFMSFLESRGAKDIDLTFGVLDTKNWLEMVHKLKPYVRTWRLLSPDSERALPLQQIQQELSVSGNDIRIEAYGNDYERCLKDIFSQGEDKISYITGSMYMVGKLRGMLSVPVKPLWVKVEKPNGV